MVCAYNAIPRANVETSEVAKNRAQHTLTVGGRLYAVLYFYIPVLYRQLYSSLSTLYFVSVLYLSANPTQNARCLLQLAKNPFALQ